MKLFIFKIDTMKHPNMRKKLPITEKQMQLFSKNDCNITNTFENGIATIDRELLIVGSENVLLNELKLDKDQLFSITHEGLEVISADGKVEDKTLSIGIHFDDYIDLDVSDDISSEELDLLVEVSDI